jgi:serine/threonine protein kinase
VHLDLKPTNVLYRASGEAVLVDFGLAHHSHYPDLLAEELRFPVGNWVYMAPEQVLGVRCDPRSDVYALGGILYELATARLPFGKPVTSAQLRRRLYRDPIPPRGLEAATPAWLQEIILHCLEIDARDRYASAAQVAFDLANPAQVAITERGTRLRRAGWATLFRQWMRAKRFEPAPCPLIDQSRPSPKVLSRLPPRSMKPYRGAARCCAPDRWRSIDAGSLRDGSATRGHAHR